MSLPRRNKTSISELVSLYKLCKKEHRDDDTIREQLAGLIYHKCKNTDKADEISKEVFRLCKLYVGIPSRNKYIHSELYFKFSYYLYSSLKV